MSPSFLFRLFYANSVFSALSALNLFPSFPQRPPQIPPRPRHQPLRLPRRHFLLQHHQRHPHIVSRRPQSVFRRGHTLPARFRQNPQRPFRNLFIRLHHINHQVLIHMPQPHHHCRTQHVQNHLLRRPCLQPRRPRQHLWPHFRRNHNFRHSRCRRLPVRSDGHRRRSVPSRILQRSHHVRRRPARRNSHNHIVVRHFSLAQLALRIAHGVLGSFHRPGHR